MKVARHVRRLAFCGLLACGPLAGCQSFSMDGLFSLPGRNAQSPTAAAVGASAPPLAPDPNADQTAKICLSTAIELDKGGKQVEAIALYEHARLSDPRSPLIARRLAVLYDRQGQTLKAVAEYEGLLKIAPRDPDLLNDLGYCYYTHGKWADAETQLRRALAVNPGHGRAWINLGMTLAQTEHYKESLEAFTHAVPPAQAHCNLAFILTTQGKREEAKGAYRTALTIDPGLSLARTALAKLDNPRPLDAPPAAPAVARNRPAPPSDIQQAQAETTEALSRPITVNPFAPEAHGVVTPAR